MALKFLRNKIALSKHAVKRRRLVYGYFSSPIEAAAATLLFAASYATSKKSNRIPPLSLISPATYPDHLSGNVQGVGAAKATVTRARAIPTVIMAFLGTEWYEPRETMTFQGDPRYCPDHAPRAKPGPILFLRHMRHHHALAP